MTSSLTDRYVTATVRSLDDDQRAEVERELRTTIEDMIDGRLEAGDARHGRRPSGPCSPSSATRCGSPPATPAGRCTSSGRPSTRSGDGC